MTRSSPTPSQAQAGPDGDAILTVEHLVKDYRVGRKQLVRAVDDVSFAVPTGETFGLVGESGSGKTTVARTVLRIHEPNSGRVWFAGRDLLSLSQSEMRRTRRMMQIVFQDPLASLNRRKTVVEIISAPMVAQGERDRRHLKSRVAELLDLVGLSTDFTRRYPHEISGGQCQRVGIARALALQPRLVILDEAVSSLDVSIRAQILNLLNALQAQFGLTYLFISHDLAIVRYMSTTVAVMYMGRIVEIGPRDKLFEDPQHPYTHALMAAIPVPDPVAERSRKRVLIQRDIGASELERPAGCRFAPRCPVGHARDLCRTVDPPLHAVAEGHLVACHFPQSAGGILAGQGSGEEEA